MSTHTLMLYECMWRLHSSHDVMYAFFIINFTTTLHKEIEIESLLICTRSKSAVPPTHTQTRKKNYKHFSKHLTISKRAYTTHILANDLKPGEHLSAQWDTCGAMLLKAFFLWCTYTHTHTECERIQHCTAHSLCDTSAEYFNDRIPLQNAFKTISPLQLKIYSRSSCLRWAAEKHLRKVRNKNGKTH